MTIPGRGDLAPPRRRRYGYRRRSPWPRVLAVVVVVALLAAAGWFGWQHFAGGDGSTPAAAPRPKPCPSPSFRTTLPPHPTPVVVLNSTKQDGLAHHVAKALSHGPAALPVGHVGNAKRGLEPSVVTYPPGDALEGWLVAASVQPAARPAVAQHGKHVQLVIGSAYRRLASPAEMADGVRAAAAAALRARFSELDPQRARECVDQVIHVAG